jgi:hypothetical protein
VDLEWNRKTIFEKLDWLKETLEDVIAKANHNMSVHQKQLRAICVRLKVLEKPAPKPPTPAKKSAKSALAKKSTSVKRGTARRPTKKH